MEIVVTWTGEGMVYTGAGADAPAITIDGMRQAGPSPMLLLLHAVAACSAIDVVDILEKKRTPITGLTVTAKGQRAEGKAGRPWKEIHLQFVAEGNITLEQVEKAIVLSLEKYCSVALNLKGVTQISHSAQVIS